MSISLRKAAWLGAAATLALTAGTASPARAADPPCNGIFQTDPADDGIFVPGGTADFLLGLTEEPAPENLEVLNTYLNNAGGQVTVNITIKNLTRDVEPAPASTGGNWYYSYFVHGGRIRFVRAVNTGSGDITYAYGYVTSENADYGGDALGGFYITEGDTTGTFTEGPGGVVSIVIPPAIGGTTGQTLAHLAGTAETIEGENDEAGINHVADSAPDDYSVSDPDPAHKSYTVIECPAGSAPPPSDGGGGGTPPPPTGGGDPPPTTGGGSGLSELPFKATKSNLGSARKAKKRRSLKFKVTAERDIENLRVSLRKGNKKPVATAALDMLQAGTRKLKLKASRKIRKGKYVLVAQGTVEGDALSTTQSVKLRK